MTSAVTGSTAVPSASFPRCPASSTRSTSIGCRLPDARVTFDSRLASMSDTREFKDIRTGASTAQAEDAPALPVDEFMAGLEALQAEVATAKNVVWERVADGTLSMEYLKRFAKEYYFLGKWYTSEFGSLVANAPDADALDLSSTQHFHHWLQNLADETGYTGDRNHVDMKVHAYAEEDHGQMADFLLRQVAQTAGQQRRIRRAIEHVLTLRNARTLALNKWLDDPAALRSPRY